MTKGFKLTDGREGEITIDDKLVDLLGEDWAENHFAEMVAKLEAGEDVSS
jgi:hypothetical protein